jgi:hypothetical protein
MGMPGTGKTHLIANIINIFQKLKKKVLVCSFTNSALDNIIIKMKKVFPETISKCIRFSKMKNSVHEEVHSIIYSDLISDIQSVEAY